VSAHTAPQAGRLGNHLSRSEPPATGAPTGGGLDLPPRKRPPQVAADIRPAPVSRKERSRT
jgi:hypothetical protein